jgi:pimeloyl-ACP methyl ester carboxylesterase
MTPDEYRERTRSVTTAHGEFVYLDEGEGQPVLFLHGLFMSAFMWHRVIDAISDDRRCIAYNLPHHGGSTVPDEQGLTLSDHVDMIVAFCDALGLETFDVVANDTGGALAQGLAIRLPDRVRTLTLTNCEAKDWLPSYDDLAQMVHQLATQGHLAAALVAGHDDLAAARQGPLAEPYQWPDRISDDEILAIIEPHQATLDGARNIERSMLALEREQLVDLEPKLRELQVPTLLAWGTADKVFPLHLAEWLRETIPGAQELVAIDGGKLFWPFERGEELVPHVRRHWEQAVPA